MKINTGRGTIPLITLIGIWSISALTSLPGLAVSPILGQLSTTFPDASELDIQMLSSLPSLLIIPFILLAGKLAEKRDFVRLLRAGLWMFAASGVLYLFSTKMWQLIAVSALLGIGAGLIIPLSTGLISRYFTGTYRVKQFGYSSAITNVTLVVATAVTGYLAEVNWHLPFLVYLLPLVAIILTIHLKDENADGEAQVTSSDKSPAILLHRQKSAAPWLSRQVWYSCPSSAATDAFLWAYHLYCIDRDVQPSVPDGGTSLFQWELGNDDFSLLPCYHGTRFLSGACCKVSEGKDEVLQPAVYCTGVGTDMDFSQRMADHTGLHTGRIGLWCYPTVDL